MTVYTVTGMTCGRREKAVGSALSDLDGATAVRADVATGLVTVNSEGEPDNALVRDAVDEAGCAPAGLAPAPAAR